MVKLLLRFFSILPLPLNHQLGSMIGRIFYIFSSDPKRVVSTNIELCFPDLDRDKKNKLIKKTLIEIGKGLTESGIIWFNNFAKNSQHINKINGEEFLDSNKPTILLVPHFGCWEITGRVISLSRPVTFLYKQLRSDRFESFLFSKRHQGDLEMASADKKGVIKLQRALSNNKLIGILPDQDPGEEGSILAPFFNKNVRTMTLLVKLARKNDAQVLMTWAERLDHGNGYILNLKPINVLSESNNIKDDVTLMNRAIEELIETKPEQYLFNYKRFKSSIKY
tara:strand:- start:1064 stop:1903 length:840 start_codon:yes stop_codon:yes gene_type:complete